MKISWDYKKNQIIYFVVFTILSQIAVFMTKANWWYSILFVAAYFVLLNIKVETKKEIPWVFTLVLFVGGASLSVFSAQYMLLEWEDFVKTTDLMVVTNIVLVLAVFFLVQAFSNDVKLTCYIANIFFLVFSFIDYFVYNFRGNEFTYADFKSIGTGLSVATKYTFSISDRCVYVIFIEILFIMLAKRVTVEFESVVYMRIISVLLTIVAGLFVAINSVGRTTETWEKKGTYRNGYYLNFVLGIRDSFVSAPDDYSLDTVNKLEKQYVEADSGKSKADVKKPTIIVIMNESYADLSVLGDFETNKEVTPFINSLSENTVKGYALSSVYGAKTPNSEWEYLTGNSMAFLPDGSVVYQQYMDDEPTSIVSTLKNEGYTCVAMHPYYETGWSRNKVYPKLGFDEKYFIDDFDEDNVLREYITDQELYDGIIRRFEEKDEDENLFMMNITMQNHGGYGEPYDNFNQEIRKRGYSYTDGNQYLSLLYESDKATENLINYFRNVDEPVEIVFFGDHQPGLCNEFISLINGKGTSGLSEDELEALYTVPFFIWTNYDTPEENVEITSLNYLSTMTLERANIDLPAYNQFLAEMMEEVPAINARGYYSISEGKYKHIDDATGEEKKWIRNYNILQYNSMFDDENKSTLFFPYIENKKRK